MADVPDLNFLAANATEVTADPIEPRSDAPVTAPAFSEAESEERENFVLRALDGGRRERKVRENKKSPKPPRETVEAPAMPRKGLLAKKFTDLYVALGSFMLPFDPAVANAVINAAPKCGESLEELARTNPAVRKALMGMVETSVWGQVILAHAPIMIAIAVVHVPAVRNNLGGMAAMVVGNTASPDDFQNGGAAV